MSWVYEQRTGKLYHNGLHIATGYAGHGDGRNNPAMQDDAGIGPLPCGLYTIGPPENDHPKLGPFVMALLPDPGNQMFGRSDFYMHGDSVKMPGTASHGCIIQARAVREQVAASGDTSLEVVADYQNPPEPVEGVDA